MISFNGGNGKLEQAGYNVTGNENDNYDNTINENLTCSTCLLHEDALSVL